MVHDGGHAGVGRQQEGALKLFGPQAGNLQMLVHRQTLAVPGQIADVDKDGGVSGRVRKQQAQLFREQVFITNVGRQTLTLPFKWRLPQRPPVEVAQRDVHHLGKPLEEWRNELTKRHQVVLVIAPGLGLTRLEANGRVGVTRLEIPQRHADEGRLRSRGKALLQRIPVIRWQLLGQDGNGGFGRNHQRGAAALQLLGIPLQGLGHAGANLEFFVLGDVALQQGHSQGAGGGGVGGLGLRVDQRQAQQQRHGQQTPPSQAHASCRLTGGRQQPLRQGHGHPG